VRVFEFFIGPQQVDFFESETSINKNEGPDEEECLHGQSHSPSVWVRCFEHGIVEPRSNRDAFDSLKYDDHSINCAFASVDIALLYIYWSSRREGCLALIHVYQGS
jgi:hypothetical protein